jgi:hypothetical protein
MAAVCTDPKHDEPCPLPCLACESECDPPSDGDVFLLAEDEENQG